jgi:hypothetical protein
MTNPTDSEPEEPPLWAELSEGPAAPPPDLAPVAATLAEPAPRIPIDRDRWFVEPQNGRRMGPFTWKELLGCVKAKMFFADDVTYGESNSSRLYLRDLFPAAAVRPQEPPAEQVGTPSSATTVVFAPQDEPRPKTAEMYALRHRLIVYLGGFLLVFWLAGLAAVGIGFRAKDGNYPLYFIVAAGFALGLGLLHFAAALLESDLFFDGSKTRWWRTLYGPLARRNYLFAIAWVLMLIGFLLVLLVLSLAWR